jgi:proline utilization trans-activator
MVNIAFPPNPQDRAAMDSALNILGGMADKGNNHMKARHQLLVNLRSSAYRLQHARVAPYNPFKHDQYGGADQTSDLSNDEMLSGPTPSLEATAAFSGELPDNTTEDVDLWEQVYGDLSLGMDFDWDETGKMVESWEIGHYLMRETEDPSFNQTYPT